MEFKRQYQLNMELNLGMCTMHIAHIYYSAVKSNVYKTKLHIKTKNLIQSGTIVQKRIHLRIQKNKTANDI